jgi:regulation of enolase protein 1 (concanavalin A-like superfamily)
LPKLSTETDTMMNKNGVPKKTHCLRPPAPANSDCPSFPKKFFFPLVQLFLFALSYGYPTPIVYPDSTLSGIGIQKTMAKLSGGQPVKIVFFGQSIVAGNSWVDSLTKYLRTKFPSSAITMVNAAIGGCAAECMTGNNNVESKLVPQRPDLVILYIYYHMEPDMEALIKQMVAKLPGAEILVFNFHYSPATTTWSPEGQASEIPWEDAASWDYLPALCEKYNLGYLDIRAPWVSYLASFYNGKDALTVDGIHLNSIGQNLMSLLPRPYFAVRHDVVAPTVDSIRAQGKKLWIRFSEKIDSASATTSLNYSISGGPTITNVTLNADKRTAVALVAATLAGGTYTVGIDKVKDRAGNTMAPVQKNVTVTTQTGWASCDIGRVFTPGSTVINAATGEFSLRGGGEHASPINCAWVTANNPCDPYWIWRNEFHYAYKTLEGDFTLTAQINNTDSCNAKSQVGIIVREDLQYLSKFVAINTVKMGRLDFVKRTNPPDSITLVKPRSNRNANLWLRLRRTGASFEAFTATDTSSWASEGVTSLPMTSQVTAGLFVCGNEYSRGPYTAKFRNVSIALPPVATAPGPMAEPPEQSGCVVGVTAKGIIVRKLKTAEPIVISIDDVRGRTMLKIPVQRESCVISRSLPGGSGVYILSVNGQASTHRIIIAER